MLCYGFLPANFQLATPFHSRLRVRHGTDRRADNGHRYIMPHLLRRGHKNSMGAITVNKTTLKAKKLKRHYKLTQNDFSVVLGTLSSSKLLRYTILLYTWGRPSLRSEECTTSFIYYVKSYSKYNTKKYKKTAASLLSPVFLSFVKVHVIGM